MAKFVKDKCKECGENLADVEPVKVVELRPHKGETGIQRRTFAPCPSCGAGITVVKSHEAPPEE